MKTDMQKLREFISSKGMNFGAIAKKIGINRSTFYRKVGSDGENFTIGEVHRMMEVLPMTVDEVISIFYRGDL